MSRMVPVIAALGAVLASPALAADYMEGWPEFRGGHDYLDPKDWTELGDPNDTVSFEAGLRYYYSRGSQNFTISGGNATTSDETHAVEAYGRIDDYLTRTYGEAIAAYAFSMRGTFDSGNGVTGAISDGRMAHIGAEVGWYALGDNNGGAGPLVGYLYWNDSPRSDRINFTTATSGAGLAYDPATGQIFFTGNSSDTNIDIHAVKLGVAGRAELGDMIDITAEASAIPYAYLSGVLGNHAVAAGVTPLGNPNFVKTSQTSATGWGYGAMGELMVGITPHENVAVRIGGRAMYLTGTYDATYTAAQIGDPQDINPADGTYDTAPIFVNQGYIETRNPFSLFRYGLLAEVSYRF